MGFRIVYSKYQIWGEKLFDAKKNRTNCNLTIGKDYTIQDYFIMNHSEKDNVVIGNNALIRSDTIIYFKVNNGNNFKTDHRAFIRENSEIGDNVLIGLWVATVNDKYVFTDAKLIRPTIKKKARTGANSTILPGVIVGEGAVMGSGTIVTKDVALGKMVEGNPGRILNRKN
jgi:acetyltransferase-like isoleucine patch superfamily enzyme